MAQVIDKTSSKYIVALKFVNAILKNLDKPEISDLLEFKDVARKDIIKPENKALIDTYSDELFKKGNFKKNHCNFYQRNKIANYILTLLRTICTDLDFTFTYVDKRIKDGNKYKSHILYAISM